jgi:hypothetical protein
VNEHEMVEPILVKLEDAAAALSVSVKWIRTHRKELPFVREIAPRVLRVDVAAMRRWVDRRR